VVEARVGQHIHHASGGARLRVVSRPHHARYARQHDRPGAHRARLECDVQDGVEEPPAGQVGSGFTQGEDLGVRGRVAAKLPLVAGRRDDLTPVYNDRADRHVVVLEGALCLAQSEAHEVLVAREEAHWSIERPSAARLAPGLPIEPVAPVERTLTTSASGGCSCVRTLSSAP
jgi:hypothetical protein